MLWFDFILIGATVKDYAKTPPELEQNLIAFISVFC